MAVGGSRWRAACVPVLKRLRGGELTIREPGRPELRLGEPGSALEATIEVRDPDRFWGGMLGGSVGLGEAYRDGAWDCEDLVALTRIGARAMFQMDGPRRRVHPLVGPFQRLARRVPLNTRAASRRQISAHYDLGNDFFALYLDDSMMYSAARFEDPEATLAEAQEAKLDGICRALELGPDDHLLEIGTGWGALAEHAAGRYGCRVTTTTISREQRAGALRRLEAAGLGDRVEVLLSDYRDLRGRFDKLVSIEMVEAVGWQYFGRYFEQCSRLLEPEGLFLLQAIVVDDRAYETEKLTRSFANMLIFPGGCLPSVEVIQRCIAERTDMSTLWLEDISAHYAETIRHWRERFAANEAIAGEMGYDEPFRRLWTLWLALCEGGFRERRIRDVQMLFSKPAYRPAVAPAISAGRSPSLT